jgi:hypothetical protein
MKISPLKTKVMVPREQVVIGSKIVIGFAASEQ